LAEAMYMYGIGLLWPTVIADWLGLYSYSYFIATDYYTGRPKP